MTLDNWAMAGLERRGKANQCRFGNLKLTEPSCTISGLEWRFEARIDEKKRSSLGGPAPLWNVKKDQYGMWNVKKAVKRC